MADFVIELHRQTAFIAAVLGGFATAFLGALVAMDRGSRSGTWAIGFATASAAAFVVTTFSATVVMLDLVRDGITSFDFSQWQPSTYRAKWIADICPTLGMFSLLLSLTFSGWVRSTTTGIVTTVIGGTGLVVLAVVAAGTL